MDTSGERDLMYSEGLNLKDWEFLVPQESMDIWAVILDDPNPIHLDANAVKQVGLGNKTINQGPANIAYILNMIELERAVTPGQSAVIYHNNECIGGGIVS